MKKETDLEINEPSLVEPMALSKIFIESGMFKDVKSQAEACVKILAGRELGLKPIQAMNEIYIVNGRTSVTAKVIAGLLIKSGKYTYCVNKIDDTECSITFFENIDGKKVEKGISTFTFKDAAKAGLVNKDVWKNYPRNMLFSRAMANGQRWFAPDIFSGYTSEEVENIPSDKNDEQLVSLEFDSNNGEKIIETEFVEGGK